jgi:hypothetical protein
MEPEPHTNAHNGSNVNQNEDAWNENGHEKFSPPVSGCPNGKLAITPCKENRDAWEKQTKNKEPCMNHKSRLVLKICQFLDQGGRVWPFNKYGPLPFSGNNAETVWSACSIEKCHH